MPTVYVVILWLVDAEMRASDKDLPVRKFLGKQGFRCKAYTGPK